MKARCSLLNTAKMSNKILFVEDEEDLTLIVADHAPGAMRNVVEWL